jgi:hypothetical protein
LSFHDDLFDLGFNVLKELRSDKIPVNYENLRLRYVNCQEAPFAASGDQNVCVVAGFLVFVALYLWLAGSYLAYN